MSRKVSKLIKSILFVWEEESGFSFLKFIFNCHFEKWPFYDKWVNNEIKKKNKKKRFGSLITFDINLINFINKLLNLRKCCQQFTQEFKVQACVITTITYFDTSNSLYNERTPSTYVQELRGLWQEKLIQFIRLTPNRRVALLESRTTHFHYKKLLWLAHLLPEHKHLAPLAIFLNSMAL